MLYNVPLRLEVAEGLRKGLACGVVLEDMLSAICGCPNCSYMPPWHLELKNALHECVHEATPSVHQRESGEANNPTSDFLLKIKANQNMFCAEHCYINMKMPLRNN